MNIAYFSVIIKLKLLKYTLSPNRNHFTLNALTAVYQTRMELDELSFLLFQTLLYYCHINDGGFTKYTARV